jgi:hypothetical protein
MAVLQLRDSRRLGMAVLPLRRRRRGTIVRQIRGRRDLAKLAPASLRLV